MEYEIRDDPQGLEERDHANRDSSTCRSTATIRTNLQQPCDSNEAKDPTDPRNCWASRVSELRLFPARPLVPTTTRELGATLNGRAAETPASPKNSRMRKSTHARRAGEMC